MTRYRDAGEEGCGGGGAAGRAAAPGGDAGGAPHSAQVPAAGQPHQPAPGVQVGVILLKCYTARFSQCPEKASTRAFSLLTAPYEIRLRIYANIANQTVGRMLVSSSRSHCSKLKCYTILQRSTASNEFNFIQHSQHYHPAVTVRTMLHFHLLSKFQFYCSEKSSNCKLSDGVNANFHWKLLLFIYSGFPSSFNKI